jgi:hypothetical protein
MWALRTPDRGPTVMAMSMTRERRIRNYTLIPFVVLGILAGALGGLAFALGSFGSLGTGPRNPGGLVFFIAPPMVGWALGSIAYRLAMRFAPVRPDDDGL